MFVSFTRRATATDFFFFFCFGRFGAGEQNGFFSLSKMALERMREKISEYSGTLIQ